MRYQYLLVPSQPFLELELSVQPRGVKIKLRDQAHKDKPGAIFGDLLRVLIKPES